MSRTRTTVLLATLCAFSLGAITIAGCSGSKPEPTGAAATAQKLSAATDLRGVTKDGWVIVRDESTNTLQAIAPDGTIQQIAAGFPKLGKTRVMGNVVVTSKRIDDATDEVVAWSASTGVTSVPNAYSRSSWNSSRPTADGRHLFYRVRSAEDSWSVAAIELGSTTPPETLFTSTCAPRFDVTLADEVLVTSCADFGPTGLIKLRAQIVSHATSFTTRTLAETEGNTEYDAFRAIGKYVTFTSQAADGTSVLNAVPLAGGTPRELARGSVFTRELKDGSGILFLDDASTLKMVSFEGGATKQIATGVKGVLDVSQKGDYVLVYSKELPEPEVQPEPEPIPVDLDAGPSADAGDTVDAGASSFPPVSKSDVLLVSVATGQVTPLIADATGAAGRGTSNSAGIPGYTGFSADGKWVLYFKNVGERAQGTLVARPLAGGKEVELATDATWVDDLEGSRHTVFEYNYTGELYYQGEFSVSIGFIDLNASATPTLLADGTTGMFRQTEKPNVLYYAQTAASGKAGVYRFTLP